MTYVLAWKTDSEVFLAADSALTTRPQSNSPKLDLSQSSFGQKHFVDEEKKVEERTLKLFLRHRIGVALAGHYNRAIKIIGDFYEKFEKEGLDPESALKVAVFLNSPPAKDTEVQLVIGYFDGSPKLISYNSQGDEKIRSDETIVHLGSAPKDYRILNEIWLKEITPDTNNKPKQRLASIIAVLQSHGALDPLLMAQGIGGAFAGLYIIDSDAAWQPDLFFIEGDKLVNTCIRHDCMVINSPTIGESRCFMTFIPPKSKEFLMEQTAKAIKEGEQLRRKSEYDFVIFINTEKKNITLIEMDKHKRHELIWLEPFYEGNRSGTKVSKFPPLKNILERSDGMLFSIPYRAPTVDHIPPDQVIQREVDPNKEN